MRTVIGLFDRQSSLDQALAGMGDIGVGRGQISLIDNEAAIHQVARFRGSIRGSLVGMFIGGAFGALLGLALTMLALAGEWLQPVVDIGPMTTYFGTPQMVVGSVLAWAGLWAGLGSLVGALIGESRQERQARVYSDAVAQGKTMMVVRATNEQAQAVTEQLSRHGAEAVDAQRYAWKRGDWHAFDMSGPPLRRPGRV